MVANIDSLTGITQAPSSLQSSSSTGDVEELSNITEGPSLNGPFDEMHKDLNNIRSPQENEDDSKPFDINEDKANDKNWIKAMLEKLLKMLQDKENTQAENQNSQPTTSNPNGQSSNKPSTKSEDDKSWIKEMIEKLLAMLNKEDDNGLKKDQEKPDSKTPATTPGLKTDDIKPEVSFSASTTT